MNIALWIVQVLLALVYLFAGGSKFAMSGADMQAQMEATTHIVLPIWFIRFIGTCELLGALGIILPGLFRTKTFLTPLAAAGFVIIMIGAVTIGLIGGVGLPNLFPGTVGVLAAFVAYGRWKVAPLRSR